MEILALVNNQISLDKLFNFIQIDQKQIMEIESSSQILIIGYYPFRAKAHICRLLCQYLHINYVNRFFTPDQWNKFKENQAQSWIIKDLPFLIHKDITVTGTTAMIYYILEVAGRVDMLGRNVPQMVRIDSIRIKFDVRNAILSLVCTQRPKISPEDKKSLQHYWNQKIKPIIQSYQNQCPQQNWYFGFISVMDFIIYDIMSLMDQIFPSEVHKFKKLDNLRKRLAKIKQIQQYQNSSRAIKQFCPVSYFSRFLQQKKNQETGTEIEHE